jgi:hypothetical protein
MEYKMKSGKSKKICKKKKNKRYTEQVLLFFIFYFMDSLSPQVAAFSFPEKYFKIIPE